MQRRLNHIDWVTNADCIYNLYSFTQIIMIQFPVDEGEVLTCPVVHSKADF